MCPLIRNSLSRRSSGSIVAGLVTVVLLTVGCGGAGRDEAAPYATAAATSSNAQVASGVQRCVSGIFTALEFDSLDAQSQEEFATDVGWLVLGLRRLFVPEDSPTGTASEIRESASRFCAGASDYLINLEFSDPDGTEMAVADNRDLIAHLHVAALHDALDLDGTPIARKVPRAAFDELAARVCAEVMNRGILDFSAGLRDPAIDKQAFERVLTEAMAGVSLGAEQS